jgi:hypothetical protein
VEEVDTTPVLYFYSDTHAEYRRPKKDADLELLKTTLADVIKAIPGAEGLWIGEPETRKDTVRIDLSVGNFNHNAFEIFHITVKGDRPEAKLTFFTASHYAKAEDCSPFFESAEFMDALKSLVRFIYGDITGTGHVSQRFYSDGSGGFKVLFA